MDIPTAIKPHPMSPVHNEVKISEEMAEFLYNIGLESKNPALRWTPPKEEATFLPNPQQISAARQKYPRNRKNNGNQYIVDEVLDRKVDASGVKAYLIKWEGFSSAWNTWEPAHHLKRSHVKEYEKRQAPSSEQHVIIEGRPKRNRKIIIIPGTVEAEENSRASLNPRESKSKMEKVPNSDEEKKVRMGYGNGIYVVEKILRKKLDSSGAPMYLIKWLGYHSSENTWEPPSNIAPNMIHEFESEGNFGFTSHESEYNENGTDSTKEHEGSVDRRVEKKKSKRTTTADNGNDGGSAHSSKPHKKSRLDGEKHRRHQSSVASSSRTDHGSSAASLAIATKSAARKIVKAMANEKENPNQIYTESNLDGRHLKEIVGAVQFDKDMLFLVSFFDADGAVLVKNEMMRQYFPLQLIGFYEKNLRFTFEADA